MSATHRPTYARNKEQGLKTAAQQYYSRQDTVTENALQTMGPTCGLASCPIVLLHMSLPLREVLQGFRHTQNVGIYMDRVLQGFRHE